MIYDVRTAIRDTVDDTRFSDRYIIYLYNLKRSKYLRNDANNLQKLIDNSILQKFCMEMEEVSVNECGLDYDCGTIMRSTKVIPIPLELHLKSAITEVKPSVKITLASNRQRSGSKGISSSISKDKLFKIFERSANGNCFFLTVTFSCLMAITTRAEEKSSCAAI